MKYKIVFNNGTEVFISKEIAEIINTNILEGCGQFQTFTDEQGLFLVVNMQSVNCIVRL